MAISGVIRGKRRGAVRGAITFNLESSSTALSASLALRPTPFSASYTSSAAPLATSSAVVSFSRSVSTISLASSMRLRARISDSSAAFSTSTSGVACND